MESNWPSAYNPKGTEEKIYKLWQESGFFTPENLPDGRKEKFVTYIAPPNITGELHMGHALELTIQDIIVRMKRMRGYKTLWLPGTDHAGIAAQNVVEKQLAKESTNRHALGREKFLERMWQWKEKYGGAILEQLKKLGCSVDWSRLRFTMDPDYQKAVQEAFIHYYKKGWIYQGERVINWCVRCATGISDLEVNHVPEKAKLYFIKYGPFSLATVRPETKLGDTALAVHPNDKRYKKHVGKELEIESVDNTVPLSQAAKLKKIKIIVVADEAVDPKFGTGIIKVTPAHDLTDFEIAQRHSLPSVKIIDEQGRMNENAGTRYRGLKTSEAREQIVKDLEAIGLIEKIEDYEHNVARCDRCNSVIEPLPSKQWFLKMKNLSKLALDAVEKGKVKIHPARWKIPYRNWLKNVRDWNISRQLWWGHRLPVWYHEPKCIPKLGQEKEIEKCLEIKVSIEEPKCDYCNAKYIQSEDVLDTWFSSALWPFATLGWPNTCVNIKHQKFNTQKCQAKKDSDLGKYYPGNFITSDRGILFLWQVRMIFSGIEFTGKPPFKDVYIHATVLTKDGKRMSKSLGTGINPLELIEKYGADALRFGLAYQTTELQDMRFNEDVIMMGKKFANKLWNIARYVEGKTKSQVSNPKFKKITESEIPIIKKLNRLAKSVAENIESYKFGEAAHDLYDFVWHDFADKYIEESKNKDDPETLAALTHLLMGCLKLLHPFMPFVTEEIWSRFPTKGNGLLLIGG